MSKISANVVVLTEELVRSGMKGGRGMKCAQALALGIPWPLRTGWLENAVGTTVSEDQFAAFTGKRDTKAKKWKPRRRRKKRKGGGLESAAASSRARDNPAPER
jgi:hypothetical protein